MNKLVRDKIVEIIQKEGREVNFSVLSNSDYEQALKTKLQEEALEVIKASNNQETLEELADLQELIDCLLTHLKITKTELKAAQLKKNQQKGSFRKRHFIQS